MTWGTEPYSTNEKAQFLTRISEDELDVVLGLPCKLVIVVLLLGALKVATADAFNIKLSIGDMIVGTDTSFVCQGVREY
jgi:hypothetical protein